MNADLFLFSRYLRCAASSRADGILPLIGALEAVDSGPQMLGGAAAYDVAFSVAELFRSDDKKICVRLPESENDLSPWRDRIGTDKSPVVKPTPADLLLRLFALDQWLRNARRPVFGEASYVELLGRSVLRETPNDRDLINLHLQPGELSFSEEAFFAYRERIKVTQKLFPGPAKFPMVLRELNVGIFRHQTLEDSLEFITDRLDAFIQLGQKLLADYVANENAYYQRRLRSYQRTYQKLFRTVSGLEWEYHQREHTYSAASSKGIGKVLAANLGGRRRKFRKAVRSLSGRLSDLMAAHQQLRPFTFSWPQEAHGLAVEEWPNLLSDYREQLQTWLAECPTRLREECLGLSAENAPKSDTDMGSSAALRQLAERLRALSSQVNESGLFQRPYSPTAATSSRQQKAVEQLLDRLHQLAESLSDYPVFYHWQKNWFGLPASLRRIITPLLSHPGEDWTSAFQRWYFTRALEDRPLPPARPPTPATLSALSTELAKVKPASTESKSKKLPVTSWITPRQPIPRDTDLLIDLCPEFPLGATHTAAVLRVDRSADRGTNTHRPLAVNRPHPALVFFQDWQSGHLPRWEAISLPFAADQWLEAIVSVFPAPPPREEVIQLLASDDPALLVTVTEEKIKAIPLHRFRSGGKVNTSVLVLRHPIEAENASSAALLDLILAADRLVILHDVPENSVTENLLSDGLTPNFLMAALIRAAVAVGEQDAASYRAMAAECRLRMGYVSPASSSFLSALLPRLQRALPDHTFSLHQPWRETYLPLVATSSKGARHLVLTDDLLPGTGEVLPLLTRLQQIRSTGYQLHVLSTETYLDDPGTALGELIEAIRTSPVSPD